MGSSSDPAPRWDDAYALGDDTRSWFQQQPTLSLQMLDAAGVSPADSLVDVGGGASPLAGALLDRGFRDVTVLDISATGMQHAQRRLGGRASQVRWLVADVLAWQPEQRYRVWHDRAFFHFLISDQERQQYKQTLHAATGDAAAAVFGCFAPDGPPYCSGLPVARYSVGDLDRELGSQWTLITRAREEHITPAGGVQPFTWAAFRREEPPRGMPVIHRGSLLERARHGHGSRPLAATRAPGPPDGTQARAASFQRSASLRR